MVRTVQRQVVRIIGVWAPSKGGLGKEKKEGFPLSPSATDMVVKKRDIVVTVRTLLL